MTGQLLRQAEQSLRQGNIEAARDLARRSEQPEAGLFLAMLESSQQQPEAALVHLHRYLKQRPGDANAWYNVGMLEAALGRWPTAAMAYEKALAAAPGHLPALVGLGQFKARQGDRDTALKLLRQAWQLDEGQPVVADALSRLLPAAEALPLLQRALQREPANGPVAARLAQLQLESGQAESALATWQQAREGGADEVACLVGQTRSLVDLQRAEEAIGPLEQAIAVAPRPALLDALGVALNAAGRREAALEQARRAVAAAPDRAGYRFNLASLLSQTTDQALLEEAAVLCRQLLSASDDDAAARHCLALALLKLGHVQDALDHARNAYEASGDPRYGLTLADCQHKLDPQAALNTLDALIRRHGASAERLRQRGIAWLKCQQPDRALQDLDQALVLDGADQRSIAHRAVALVGLGRAAEAEAYSGLDRWIFASRPPAPSGFSDLQQFNQQLAEDIRNHSLMRWEPLGLAARNGGLTDDLTADATPAITGFEALLRAAIDDLCRSLTRAAGDPFLADVPEPGRYTLNIWATLVREGGLIDTHIHEESWLSGAYYVTLPPVNEESGAIEFGRPHADLPQAAAAPVRVVVPETGLLLMFPGFLFHRTLPFQASGDRISVSFDVTPR